MHCFLNLFEKVHISGKSLSVLRVISEQWLISCLRTTHTNSINQQPLPCTAFVLYRFPAFFSKVQAGYKLALEPETHAATETETRNVHGGVIHLESGSQSLLTNTGETY